MPHPLLAVTARGLARLTPVDCGWAAAFILDDVTLQCVAVDPRDPALLLAGSRGRGVWRSGDGGATWSDAGLPERDVFSLAVSPADGAVYAGTEPSKLFRSDDGGRSWRELEALRRLPSAPTWSFPPRPWTSHVRWIAPNPREAGLLLVGIELGGLMRSEDGGASWEDHRPGAQRDVHALAWHPVATERAYEAGGGGAAWSRDGGRTWEPADEGREFHYTWALAVDPEDPDLWYVSAAPGPRQAHGGAGGRERGESAGPAGGAATRSAGGSARGGSGSARAHLYRWRGAGPWERLGGGLPQPLESMPYALVATGDVVYAGLADGRIYASRDRGDTWAEEPVRGEPLAGLRALVLARAPAAPGARR